MDWTHLRRARSLSKNQKASVLIVEDESNVRHLWQGWLIALDYEVDAVEDAPHALAMLDRQCPDVVICDVHLPGPSGLWVADQIRTRSPATAIILATGDAAVPPSESLRPGIVAYLVKPISLQALKDAVEAGLRWSAMQRTE